MSSPSAQYRQIAHPRPITSRTPIGSHPNTVRAVVRYARGNQYPYGRPLSTGRGPYARPHHSPGSSICEVLSGAQVGHKRQVSVIGHYLKDIVQSRPQVGRVGVGVNVGRL